MKMLLLALLISPPDTIEWADWGRGQAFQLRFQRSINDTTLLHGAFEAYYHDQIIIKGQFDRRRKTGIWEHYDLETGTVVARGQHVRGRQHGDWVYAYPSGAQLAKKQFNFGLSAGWQTSSYPDQKPWAQILQRNDTLVDQITFFFPTGDTAWMRTFTNHNGFESEAEHRSYYPSAAPAERYRLLVLRDDATVRRKLNRGDNYLTTVALVDPGANDVFHVPEACYHGTYRRYHFNGRRAEQLVYDRGELINALPPIDQWGNFLYGGDFDDGHGQLIRYGFDTDTARVENYAKGLRHGAAWYFEPGNRRMVEGAWQHGHPTGRWKKYDPIRRTDVLNFLNDSTIEAYRVRRNRIVDFGGVYHNYRKHGKWTYFDFYGDTLQTLNYDNGRRNGEARLFNRGSLEMRRHYRQDVPDKIWQVYNRRGKATWSDTLTAGVYSNTFTGDDELRIDMPVFTSLRFNPTLQPARLHLYYMTYREIVLRSQRMRYACSTLPISNPDVTYALDVEDTGHVIGITCLSSTKPEYFAITLEFLQAMPYMYPARLEGLPLATRQLVYFEFEELR
jgi:antitoxin component YwqK of YwqJK toxin-antitoxin module